MIICLRRRPTLLPYTTLFRSMRGVGERLQGIWNAVRHPFKEWTTLWHFGRTQVAARLTSPDVPVVSTSLKREARALSRRVRDRKSTRLNSSHVSISYAVFCLK